MTRTHGSPLIIPAEKTAPSHRPPCVIKFSRCADREAKGWGDNQFYLCKPVSPADHVWGSLTLRGWGIAPGELTSDHTQGCFSCHFSTWTSSLCRIYIRSQGLRNRYVQCRRPCLLFFFATEKANLGFSSVTCNRAFQGCWIPFCFGGLAPLSNVNTSLMEIQGGHTTLPWRFRSSWTWVEKLLSRHI